MPVTIEKCHCGNPNCEAYLIKGEGFNYHWFKKEMAERIQHLFNYPDSINLVHDFHQKFDLPHNGEDVISGSSEMLNFRMEFIREEVNEFYNAWLSKDRVAMLDALLDIVYVAQGTALFMGVTPEQWVKGMAAVQKANMAKEKPSPENPGKRNSPWDVVKPEGWVGPEAELRRILG